MGRKSRRYVADFETTTKEEDCRVWSYALISLEDDALLKGITIDGFIRKIQELRNPTIYFHNLRFDGEFILSYLLQNGFTWVKNKKDLSDNTFTTLISDKGAFYAIEVVFSRANKNIVKATFYDSLKLLPFSVAEIAKGFHLPISKGSIDYEAERPQGYEPTEEEWTYIETDVKIVASALKVLFAEGLTKMTIGSNALGAFKKEMGDRFSSYFPRPHYDEDIRQSYKGGYTYLNPVYANREIGAGIVLDVNSLYPAVMRNKPLPFGEPLYFWGEYVPDRLYDLYIVMLSCHFKLKPGYLPTIQLKENLSFIPTEYITNSNGEDVTLCLTSVDLTLFREHYDVRNISYLGGWKFKSHVGFFDQYIDQWSLRKIQAKREENHAIYIISKLMLNNLYGKFSLNPKSRAKIPWIDELGIVRYKVSEEEEREPVYLPVGTFITAYARSETIRAAQALYPRFIYADTDSLHLEGKELPENLTVHNTNLGAWKHESTFIRAKFIRAKTYIEEEETTHGSDLKIVCAGMPKACYDAVTFGNFKAGSRYAGKLVPKHVPNGLILKNVDFTINRDTMKKEGTM